MPIENLMDFAQQSDPDALVRFLLLITGIIGLTGAGAFIWYFRGRESISIMSQRTTAKMQDELSQINTKYNEIYRKQVDIDERNKELTETTQMQSFKIQYLEEQRIEDSKTIRELREEREQAVANFNDLRTDFQNREREIEALTDRINDLEKQAETDALRIGKLEQEIVRLRKERNEALSERDTMHHALSEARKEISELTSRLGKVEKRDTDNLIEPTE
jgi:chromosome segregation ATPase